MLDWLIGPDEVANTIIPPEMVGQIISKLKQEYQMSTAIISSTLETLRQDAMTDLVNALPAEKVQTEVDRVVFKELVTQTQAAIQPLVWAHGFPHTESFRTDAAKAMRLCRLLAQVIQDTLNNKVPVED